MAHTAMAEAAQAPDPENPLPAITRATFEVYQSDFEAAGHGASALSPSQLEAFLGRQLERAATACELQALHALGNSSGGVSLRQYISWVVGAGEWRVQEPQPKISSAAAGEPAATAENVKDP